MGSVALMTIQTTADAAIVFLDGPPDVMAAWQTAQLDQSGSF
jgi:hypothetical protein